jgi:hypothetical protein
MYGFSNVEALDGKYFADWLFSEKTLMASTSPAAELTT